VPIVNDDDAPFWRGGERGELLIHHCADCGRWSHPPAPVCPHCHGRAVAPRAVSGRATVFAHTVNHQPWFDGLPPPYVVAIVELEEQRGLRLTTNIVGCAPDDVHAGLVVEVCFEPHGDLWLPQFRPVAVS
jgi:uncharacterized OB-fold protein